MPIRSINPATGRELASYPELSVAEIDVRLLQSEEAFAGWREIAFSERAVFLKRTAAVLRSSERAFAELMAQEMGKPVRQGEGEIEKCALNCEFYADNADRFLAREPVKTEATESFVTFNPLGVILAVMPWN